MLPSLRLGVEWNPGADEIAPLMNWRAVSETVRRPALMFSTSTDRIGTPDGQSYTATLSKNLVPHGPRPIAPYVGVAWSEHEERLKVLGGILFGINEKWSSLLIWDSENLHPTLTYSTGAHAFTFLVTTGVRAERNALGEKVPGDGVALGLAWSVVFGGRRAHSPDDGHGHGADDGHDHGAEDGHAHGAEDAHEHP